MAEDTKCEWEVVIPFHSMTKERAEWWKRRVSGLVELPEVYLVKVRKRRR